MGGELRLKFCRSGSIRAKLLVSHFARSQSRLRLRVQLSQHVRFNVVCFTLSLEHEQDELCRRNTHCPLLHQQYLS